MSKKRVIVTAILFALVPTVLAYLGKSNNVLDYFQLKGVIEDKNDVSMIKEICLCLNIIATFFIMSIKGIASNTKIMDLQNQRDNLLKQCKTILTSALSNLLQKEHLELEIRIFVEKKITIREKVKSLFGKRRETKFIIKNINGLANDDLTNKLEFEVSPKAEGLVGKSFRDKCIYYDCELEKTNRHNYNMKNSQINKTNALKFSLTCPIFDSNEKVIAVLAIDSKNKIVINDSNKSKITDSIIAFSTQLYDYVPDLFKSV